MKYLLRIKGVSECMGIRRMSLAYCSYGNGIISLENEIHPINAFKSIVIRDDEMSVGEETQKVVIGEEMWFSIINNVTGKVGDSIEHLDLRLLVVPLAKEAISYYEKAIEDRYVFDSMDGEFEYIIGLIYELELNDLSSAIEWYSKAKKKRFNFELIREKR